MIDVISILGSAGCASFVVAAETWNSSRMASLLLVAVATLSVLSVPCCIMELARDGGCPDAVRSQRRLRRRSPVMSLLLLTLLMWFLLWCASTLYGLAFDAAVPDLWVAPAFWGTVVLVPSVALPEAVGLRRYFRKGHFDVTITAETPSPGVVVDVTYHYTGKVEYDELKVSVAYCINYDPCKAPYECYKKICGAGEEIFTTRDPSRLGMGRFSFVVPGGQYPECNDYVLSFSAVKDGRFFAYRKDYYEI